MYSKRIERFERFVIQKLVELSIAEDLAKKYAYQIVQIIITHGRKKTLYEIIQRVINNDELVRSLSSSIASFVRKSDDRLLDELVLDAQERREAGAFKKRKKTFLDHFRNRFIVILLTFCDISGDYQDFTTLCTNPAANVSAEPTDDDRPGYSPGRKHCIEYNPPKRKSKQKITQ